MSEIHLPHDHGEHGANIARNMPDIQDFVDVAANFKQLGDSSRLRIFWLLCHCEECVINISAMVGMSSPAVSHHLRLLKDSGFIRSRRAGKEVYYTAAQTPVAQLLHDMIKQLLALECPDMCHFE